MTALDKQSPALLAQSWIQAIEERGELARVIKQAKHPQVGEALESFLGDVLKRAKEWSNPFYGDANLHGVDLATIPEGARDIVDDELDLRPININHKFTGGLHCLLVELVTHFCSSHTQDKSLPWIQRYTDYFLDRRGCTTCAKRILALFPTQHIRQEFIDQRTQEWIQECRPFSPTSSTFHIEMTLWLLTMSSFSAEEQMNLLHIIYSAHGNDFRYLTIYTEFHRVYRLLDWLMEIHVGAREATELRRLRQQAWRGEAELWQRTQLQEQNQQSQSQPDHSTRHFDIEEWEEWFAREEEWLSQQRDQSAQE